MWIDSHCHLNHKNIAEKGAPADIVKNARVNNVDGMLTICCRMHEEVQTLLSICDNNNNVWCSVGTHPHDAGNEAEKKYNAFDIAALANSHPKIIGIGETGLDYYYNHSTTEDQKKSFRNHLQACLTTDLPVIIHSRDAEDDTYAIIKEEGVTKGVMHCFSSKRVLAKNALKQGFYISFSGMITFPKADDLRETAKIVPLNRVLVETDAPYLAPVPYRGKTNEPAYVAKTGEFLAELYGLTTEEFAKITTENFFRLFSKAKAS